MRLWLAITVLLMVTVLTTETFAKRTKSNEVESSNSVREKHGKVTDAGNHNTKKGNPEEETHSKEHGKSKKRKGSPSEERNFANRVDGSKDSREFHKVTKSKNKSTKKEEQRTRHANEAAEAIREKVRHAKDKYKYATPNAKSNKNDKGRSSEVAEEKSSDSSSKKSMDGKKKKKSLKALVENTEKLTDGDVNAENNRNRKKSKSLKSSQDIDGTVINKKLKKSKDDKKTKKKHQVPKDEEKSVAKKMEEPNVKDSNVPADAMEIKEEPRKISKTSKARKKRHVEAAMEQELEEESHVEEETRVVNREEEMVGQEQDEYEQCEIFQEDTESCVRKSLSAVEEDKSEAADA